jgi:hypothetical protein
MRDILVVTLGRASKNGLGSRHGSPDRRTRGSRTADVLFTAKEGTHESTPPPKYEERLRYHTGSTG